MLSFFLCRKSSSEAVDAPQAGSGVPTEPAGQSVPQSSDAGDPQPQSDAPTGTEGPSGADSADEYAPSPIRRSPSRTASPCQPSPGMPPCPPSPPQASPSEANEASERTPEGPVRAAKAPGQEAAAEEVEEIPRVLPRRGLQGDTQERVQAAWVEGDQSSVIDKEKENAELAKLFDLSLEAQELIKVRIVLCVESSILSLPSDEPSRPFFLCRAWDNASR